MKASIRNLAAALLTAGVVAVAAGMPSTSHAFTRGGIHGGASGGHGVVNHRATGPKRMPRRRYGLGRHGGASGGRSIVNRRGISRKRSGYRSRWWRRR